MNCPCPAFDPQKYKGKPYEETPCATCFLTRETNKTNKHTQLYDTDGPVEQVIDDQAKTPDQLMDADAFQSQELSPEAIELIMRACEQNFLIVLSNVVLKLTDLAQTYPALYQILHLKMQYPHLSYYQIGSKMVPPCTKQNVLYHLSHAVKEFPELHKAIITDVRFSAGHNAIKITADRVAQDKQIEKVRNFLYNTTEANKRKTIEELQEDFKKPLKVHTIEGFDIQDKNEKSNSR